MLPPTASRPEPAAPSRRWCAALLLLALAACGKSPEEAAQLYVVEVSNGFAGAGGVILSGDHVLTSFDIVRDVEMATVTTGTGDRRNGTVVNRDEASQVALLRVDGEELPYAPHGTTADLLSGDPLITRVFGKGGKSEQVTGRVKKWVIVNDHAYLLTKLETPETAAGAGVFGPLGKLIGVQAFQVPVEKTYVLPIEYVLQGSSAVAAPVLGDVDEDDDFATRRKEAQDAPEPLVRKMAFENIDSRRALARSGLVAALTLLNPKAAPAQSKSVGYRIEATDGDGARRVIGKGAIPKANIRWTPLPEVYKDLTEKMIDVHGELYVEDVLTPNDYGELRVRVPIAKVCKKVKAEEVHAFTIELADRRTSGRLVFSGLGDVCAGAGSDDGDALERELFGGAAPAAASSPADGGGKKKAGKKSGKKKKKKRKKKRKR